ncbi:MAG: TonB-dependent receptor, partial [Acidobacteria bacterium]|nr:TonB-dependent receptor [Acidobacteriota bacterium]
YGQDQIEFSSHIQAIVGLRYDRFRLSFRNNRTARDFKGDEDLVSPRAGLVYRPVEPVSLYGSYTLAYLLRAGDQLASLTPSNEALDPERFNNYEVGAKWDVRPALSFTAAVYRLDRTNVAVPDPTDPSRSLLLTGQRTKGVELALAGTVVPGWSVIGGYAYQDGKVVRTQSASAVAGASLAQLPKHALSLWNRYDLTSRWGVGLGVIRRGRMFPATDNTVTLPGFTRIDAALFVTPTRQLRVQANVENLFDERYFTSSNGNQNILPGSPRALRVILTTRF